jgi:hypothetical protein
MKDNKPDYIDKNSILIVEDYKIITQDQAQVEAMQVKYNHIVFYLCTIRSDQYEQWR